ncbi:unnamed protein product [Cuscuta epithymum]|uniref:Sphingomyelin phosphodiesterase 4 n=2 Tax=Cuscuta epithymum TaxID=186058 RepID=A0AAV0FP86_9ASTE|nr:unnamed protein product [Cuscuta epithymum]CAH9137460.1 unnamed protein product [Cuscuta epithymum]
MFSRSYPTATQTKAADLATLILGASSPSQIVAACAEVDSFLHLYTADQTRCFFSITFPTLICKVFGFDDTPPVDHKSLSPSGWIDVASLSNDSELAGRIFRLLSPNSVLLSSIVNADALSLVKYVFPVERLPEWARYLLQNERDVQLLADLCPLFRNRLKEDSAKGCFQVQLNIFEYFMFWFAYYPVCRGNSEGPQTVRIKRSKRFRLENWAYSIPGLSSTKRTTEKKIEGNLYMRVLYAYLHVYVPMHDLNTHQPYRSSLLHYSTAYDEGIVERANFLVNSVIHFWLVDNDFSPLPVSLCKSFGVVLPFRSFSGETPPTSGLGEVVSVFVKYLNLNSLPLTDGADQAECVESPTQRLPASLGTAKSRDASLEVQTMSSWGTLIQRPLYRFILRTFLFCPAECSVSNASQVFTLWVNYLEPWANSLEEFTEVDSCLGMPTKIVQMHGTQSLSHRYSSAWRGFVLANYLFYSSLAMHFIGFAHKFLHTDPELIVQMVSKVMNILTSSVELLDLMKNVDIVFHLKPYGPSKSMLNTLHRFVPAIREQLQDWEDGLCESDADGSFLRENWNKDLKLFSDAEDGGLELLQLFVLRAESELQVLRGDNVAQNIECLNTLKSQLGHLCGTTSKKFSSSGMTTMAKPTYDEIFKPRGYTIQTVPIKRSVSGDEIVWLAKLLVWISGWINESLGLNVADGSHQNPRSSYVVLPSDTGEMYGPVEMIKLVFRAVLSWVGTLCGYVGKFLRPLGLKVNLRVLALKKVVMLMFGIFVFYVLRKTVAGFAASRCVYIQD